MSFTLVCTDGSAYAPSVYDHAAWAARGLKTLLQVFHVAEANESRPFPSILRTARHHLAVAGFPGVMTEERSGHAAAAIAARAEGAALVVVGKRGEHADRIRSELGRNVEDVVRHCESPVLVADRRFRPIRRVLLAYDASENARKALDFVAERPLFREVAIHLLCAHEEKPELVAHVSEAEGRLAAAGLTVSSELSSAYPDIAIATTARRMNVDMLIMGAFGHSRIRNFFLGSTTRTMLRALPVATLLFR
jgi:nucleotide-binding universal stress UspA family protein